MKLPPFKYVMLALACLGAFAINEKMALAKAAYARKAQMIDCCEIIAVVDVKSVDQVQESGQVSGWTYGQRATVVPITILKGVLPNKSTVYGGENFICASCKFEPGKALVFLNHDGQHLTGSNWHLSIRPIKTDQLDWYDGESMSPLKPAKLSDVIVQIKKELGSDRHMKSLPAELQELGRAEYLHTGERGESPGFPGVWLAYKRALESKDCVNKEQIMCLFKNGSPAGRVYAALLLYHLDQEAGKKLLSMLSGCNGTVKVQHGCKVSSVGIWQVASDLYSKSKYLSLTLSR
jgi:hypothetical protein